MAIEERDLLQKLYEQYKDRVIYTDLYFQQHQGDNVDTLLRLLAKDAGKTRGQWLTEHGFQWKETGYVEPDMQRRKAKPPVQDAFSIADYVFRAYPLAGEFIPPKEERNLLYQSAEETVRHILSGRPLKGREAVVLVLETIQLLKDWDHVSVSGVDTFWRYIFRQYGFNAENREKSTNKKSSPLREKFRKDLSVDWREKWVQENAPLQRGGFTRCDVINGQPMR